MPTTQSTQPTAASAHVARSAVLVSAFFALDKLLGVVREAVVSKAFGASAVLDAYYAAFEIPEGLNTIVTGAALTTTLIPILAGCIAQGDRGDVPLRGSVWHLASAVVNWVLLVIGLASIVAALLAHRLILVIAPGFDAEQIALATRLMRLVLVQTLVFSVSTVVTSTIQAHRHFLLPALSPMFYTLGRIFGAVVLAPHLGIFGLAWGGLLGAAFHLLVKVPWLAWRRARWMPVLTHLDLPNLLRLVGPRMLGMGATYVNFVLPTIYGSRLAAGSISSYEYAWKLMQLPETVVGSALGIVVFPTLAALAERGDRAGLRRTFSWALRLVLALSLPAAVGLLVLGRPLTALFLQRGAFDAAATQRVVHALRFFALGLVTHSALEVVARLYYAQRDMWTPFFAALGGLAVNATLGWLLLPSLAHGGIALANSLGAGLQVVILLLVAWFKMEGIEESTLAASVARSAVASAGMGAAVLAFRALVPQAGLLVTGAGGLAVGGATYVAAALVLGIREVRELPGLLLRRNRPGEPAPGAGVEKA